ncbi:c-type cytochrome [Lutimaribacter marinistellae]|uniref:C-type cytochrome n=1 Tax=Lutimaribacter marinistellae TaxID=1820329 RepID=A0ABV7TQ14_9RHOB
MRLLAVALLLAASPTAASEFYTLKGHGGPIMGIDAAPDGRVATASFDNSVGLWTDRTPHWYDGHEAAVNAVAIDGEELFSAGDDFTLRRWPGGQVIGRHKGKIVSIAVSASHVATASWDGTIGLWPRFGEGPTRFLGPVGAGVNAVTFARGGEQLYSAGMDGRLLLWDVASGRELQEVLSHGFGINELVLDPSESWLAYGAVDGVTRIRNLATGAERDFTLDRRPILALALSPDGKDLAVGDGEGYIMVIDTDAWRITRDFRAALRGPIWALAFSADGQNIHAGGIDNAVHSWPIASLGEHEPIATGEQRFLKDPETMENGERQFARKCSICHTLTPDSARRAGPSLYGLFDRPAGTLPGYHYSETLAQSEVIWTADTIDALFDEGPDHYIPGSKMPMQRIAKPQDRADLIDYLRRATRQEN